MERVDLEERTAGRRAPRRSFAAKLFVAALVCNSAAASAQMIYKQVDKAGRTIFSDRPVATASTVAFYTAAPGQSRISGVPDFSSFRAESAPALPNFATRAQSVDYKEAARRLEQAQRNLALGTDPQLGERTAVEGKSVLNELYRERQGGLAREVAAAQARLNEVKSPTRVAGAALPARVAVSDVSARQAQSARNYRPVSLADAGRPERAEAEGGGEGNEGNKP